MGHCVKPAGKWPDGVIPYKNDTAKPVKDGLVQAIEKIMRRWEAQIGGNRVSFVPWREGEHNLYILLQAGEGMASADIGRPPQGKTFTVLKVDGGLLGKMPHELGHIMGLAHEQDRITTPYTKNAVYDPNIGPRLYAVENSVTAFKVEAKKKEWAALYVTSGDYDLFSLMHYPAMPKQLTFDCKDEVLIQYCKDKGWPGLTPECLNSPSNDDATNDTWRASAGDIATLRALYAREESQS